MVGRFIEQQEVGLFEQQFGQRDAHLPASRELLGAPFPIALRESQAGEYGAHLRLHGVAVARAELGFGKVEAIGHLGVFGAGRVELSHALRELLLLVFERTQSGEHGHAFGENGAAGEREAVLRQVAEGDAFLCGDAAGIESFDAREHFEQRRFPGAVGAYQAGALVRRDQPVDTFEENLGAVALSRPVELDHGGLKFILA